MKTSYLWLVVAGCVLLLSASARAGNPQEDFDRLFGDDAKHVAPRDAAPFAEKILDAAEKIPDDPATASFLINKALEFWLKSPNNSEKSRVGEQLLSNLIAQADTQLIAKNYTEASKFYQNATTAAVAIKSKRAEDFACRKTISQQRVDAAKKIVDLKAKLDEKPKDHASARTLVLLLVLEMDDPKAAESRLAAIIDETLKGIVPLAAKEVQDIKLAQAKELAEWYKTMAGNSSTDLAGKYVSYTRAKAYYERFVAEHLKQDIELLAANKALDEITRELAKIDMPRQILPEDSLGTWLVQLANAPISKTYMEFHKDGKVTVTSFSPDFGAERTENAPITHATVYEGDWKIEKNSLTLSNSTYSSWTMPHPLGGKVKIDYGHGMKNDAVITKIAKGIPGSELAKFGGNAKSTKIPGSWECSGAKWEFHDDGTAVQKSSYYGITNYALAKWKIEKGQLVFAVAWEAYAFPYPLGKGETKGKKGYNYRGAYNYSQDVTIKQESK